MEWWSWPLLGLAAAAVLRFRVPSPRIVVGAAVLGFALQSLP